MAADKGRDDSRLGADSRSAFFNASNIELNALIL
jgi:hypothetical protein